MSESVLPMFSSRSFIVSANQSILMAISPEYSLEGLMLKLKLQYFGHLMPRTDSLGKDPDARKDWRQEENGMTEDEMVAWHHWLNRHECEQASGVGDGWEAWRVVVHGVIESHTWLCSWIEFNSSWGSLIDCVVHGVTKSQTWLSHFHFTQ